MKDEDSSGRYMEPVDDGPPGPAAAWPRPAAAARLSAHVPIRFSPALAASVKALADQDGVSVSSWIRHVVAREVQRRTPSQTRAQVGGLEVIWDTSPAASSETYATPVE